MFTTVQLRLSTPESRPAWARRLAARPWTKAGPQLWDGGSRQSPRLWPGLEDRLQDMMPVFAMEQVDMQGQTGMERKGAEKFLGQRRIKPRRFLLRSPQPDNEGRDGWNTDADPGQGLVHGHVGVAVAADPGLVAQGLGKRPCPNRCPRLLPQDDRPPPHPRSQ